MSRSLSNKHDYAGGAKQMSESDGDDDDEDDDDDESEGEWEEMSGEEAEDVVAMQEERVCFPPTRATVYVVQYRTLCNIQ
jgi:hypothetical protein